MPNHGGFSFAAAANELASNIIQSLVIDVNVELDFAFGFDLTPTFDEYASSRVPNLFIQINHFDMWGALGVLDWTSDIDLSGVDFIVSEARALLNVSSTLSSHPIRINSPSELTALVNPPAEDSERIIFSASLEVNFPVFLIYGGVGFGARIEYL